MKRIIRFGIADVVLPFLFWKGKIADGLYRERAGSVPERGDGVNQRRKQEVEKEDKTRRWLHEKEDI